MLARPPRVIIYEPRRTGYIQERRQSLVGQQAVIEHRVQFDGGGAGWFVLSETAHEMLRDDEAMEEVSVSDSSSERVNLKCCISWMRLDNPAKGESCSHASMANFSELCAYATRQKRCPVATCNAPIPRGRMSIVRDDELRSLVSSLPQRVKAVWLDANGRVHRHEEDSDDGSGSDKADSDGEEPEPEPGATEEVHEEGAEEHELEAESEVEELLEAEDGQTPAASLPAAAAESSQAAAPRERRCGICEARKRPDCGLCKACQDKPEFGGRGTQKQCCVLRRCSHRCLPSEREPKENPLLDQWVQCNRCSKWRRLPKTERVGSGWWECSLIGMLTCDVPQEELSSGEEDGNIEDADDGHEPSRSRKRVTFAEGLRLSLDPQSKTGYAYVTRLEDRAADGSATIRYRARALERVVVYKPRIDRRRAAPALPPVLTSKTVQGRILGPIKGFATALEAAICHARHVNGIEDSFWVQCDDCQKWRRLTSALSKSAARGGWTCAMQVSSLREASTLSGVSMCDEPEEVMDEEEQLHTAKEASDVRQWAQCERCSKYRRLPVGSEAPGEDDWWECSMVRLTCAIPEDVMREDEQALDDVREGTQLPDSSTAPADTSAAAIEAAERTHTAQLALEAALGLEAAALKSIRAAEARVFEVEERSRRSGATKQPRPSKDAEESAAAGPMYHHREQLASMRAAGVAARESVAICRAALNKARREQREVAEAERAEIAANEAARKEEAKKAKKAAGGGSKRKRRCRSCVGCMAADCGQCSSCLDMPKFGGPGYRKATCVQRRCVRVTYHDAMTSEPKPPMKRPRFDAAEGDETALVTRSIVAQADQMPAAPVQGPGSRALQQTGMPTAPLDLTAMTLECHETLPSHIGNVGATASPLAARTAPVLALAAPTLAPAAPTLSLAAPTLAPAPASAPACTSSATMRQISGAPVRLAMGAAAASADPLNRDAEGWLPGGCSEDWLPPLRGGHIVGSFRPLPHAWPRAEVIAVTESPGTAAPADPQDTICVEAVPAAPYSARRALEAASYPGTFERSRGGELWVKLSLTVCPGGPDGRPCIAALERADCGTRLRGLEPSKLALPLPSPSGLPALLHAAPTDGRPTPLTRRVYLLLGQAALWRYGHQAPKVPEKEGAGGRPRQGLGVATHHDQASGGPCPALL